jgi:hypothetical protein
LRIAVPVIAAVAGAVTAYLLLANRMIKGYQSRLRWIPALIAGGRFGQLAIVLLATLIAAAIGAVFGQAIIAGLEARTG